MYFCGVSTDLKKLGLSVALLLPSMLLQAESSEDVSAGEEIDKTAVNQWQSGNHRIEQQAGSGLSRVPQQLKRNIIPPPPPGPYMSSALSDFSVKGPSFGNKSDSYESNKAASGLESSNTPMETFSPDRPWIDHAYRKHMHGSDCPPACTPGRWMPENGYQYAPLVKKKLYPAQQSRMPGSMRAPDMNWSGSRLPPKGKAPYGPYPHAPNYAPNYTPGNDFAPRYNAPMN